MDATTRTTNKKPTKKKGTGSRKTRDDDDKVKTIESAMAAIKETIDAAQYRATMSSQLNKLVSRFNSDLRGIERRLNEIRPIWSSRDRTFRERLESACEGVDPLLIYCVDKVSDGLICRVNRNFDHEELLESAIKIYINAPNDFDVVFGDHLPEKLQDEAEPRLARKRYRDGTHDSAREDWCTFGEIFFSSKGGLTTGLAAMDTALGGGLRGVTVVGGDESSGKTSLCLNIMVAALRANPKLGCVYYTLDQTKTQTFQRLLSLVSGLSLGALRIPKDERPNLTVQQLGIATEELRNSLLPRIKLVERANLSVTDPLKLKTLVEYHTRLVDSSGVDKILVVVDLFQSMTEFLQPGTANEVDEQCLAMIQQYVDRSKTSDAPEGSPILLASEVRKTQKDREGLRIDDLRGSARLGSTPSNILLLWPTPNTEQSGDVVSRTLKVAKCREGDAGVRLNLSFQHKICRFDEVSTGNTGKTGRRPKDSGQRTGRRDAAKQL